MTSRMASIAAGALPALKKKCGALSWQPDCASAPPSPKTWWVGGLVGRPGWWDRRLSPRLTLTLTLTLTPTLTLSLTPTLTSVTSSGSKTVTSCTTLDSDLPTGALLAASVLVTYLGEGGGDEGGGDEGGGGGLGMGGGGEGGGGLGGVCRWWRWWKSAATRPRPLRPPTRPTSLLTLRAASRLGQPRPISRCVLAGQRYRHFDMATHCSTRDPSRLSPPHGGTRLREEPMNTTVLSVVVIGELEFPGVRAASGSNFRGVNSVTPFLSRAGGSWIELEGCSIRNKYRA